MSENFRGEAAPQELKILTAAFIGLLGISGNLSNAIYPVFVTTALAGKYATTSNVGILASAEFFSYGIAIILGGKLRLGNHLRATVGLCLLMQLLTAYATTKLPFDLIVASRAIFGLCCGILIRTVYAYAAQTAQPGRLVGIYTTVLMIVGIGFSWVIPTIVLPSIGPASGVVLLCSASALALVLLPLCPMRLRSEDEPAEHALKSTLSRMPLSSLLVLLSIGFWAAFMTIYWVYAEPIAALIPGGIIRYWLTVSLVLQILGAAFSALLANRLAFRPVIAVGLIASVVQIVSVLVGVGGTGFVIGTAIYGFFGYFLVPFYVAALIETDPSRRSVPYLPAAQLLAGSVGPLVVSHFVSETNLSAGLIIDLAAISLAPLFFWWALALLKRERHERRASAEALPEN